ncbi:MAG TPA: hypothetical protein DC047_18005 [Blastocatellia bacterium]|nr:hypothetical protein [Blastocatellia bacterium]
MTTGDGVIELLKSGGVITSNGKAKPKIDLLHCRSIDRAQLAGFLQHTSAQLFQASALAYLKEEEVTSLASKNLRYCPKCLRAGYHTPLHQFLFLRRCPAHPNEVLTESCAACGRDPVLYDMNSVDIQPSTGATCCLGVSDREGKSGLFEKFQPLAKLLAERSRLKTLDQPIERWLGPQCATNRRRQKLPQLIRYWEDLASTQAHDAREGKHFAITSNSIREDSGSDSYQGEDRTLYLIYKSIYRYVMRTHLRTHRVCTERLMRRMWSDRSLFINRGKTCVAASAFLLWRLSWERVQTPHQLSTKHLRASVYWLPPSDDIPKLALYRIFALECLGVFEECLLLAERFHRKHIFSFNPGWVKQKRLPYWVVQANENGSTVIHWWGRPAVPKRIENHARDEESPGNFCRWVKPGS